MIYFSKSNIFFSSVWFKKQNKIIPMNISPLISHVLFSFLFCFILNCFTINFCTFHFFVLYCLTFCYIFSFIDLLKMGKIFYFNWNQYYTKTKHKFSLRTKEKETNISLNISINIKIISFAKDCKIHRVWMASIFVLVVILATVWIAPKIIPLKPKLKDIFLA